MPGINQLSDIYKKKGKEFVDKLFNSTVTVSEKLDGSIFCFEKNLTDEEISFYKRDQDNPITTVDRVLMTYYERPINYINSLPRDIKMQIPNGWRFGMEYFCDNNPVNISYQRVPKNGLVLTHITIKNEFGESIRNAVEKKELDYWADLLDVEKSPILFQGDLNEDQKIKILEYLSTPYNDILKKYKTDSFVRFMISVLNPEMEKTCLNDSLDSPIEGIVFRFGDIGGEGESYVAKIVDPVFLEIIKQKKLLKGDSLPSDIYSLALIDVMNFILEKGFDHFNSDGDDSQTRYINFIFDVFIKFTDLYSDKYKGVDFNEPDYFKRKEFGINRDLINNDEVRNKIDENESFETLLKIILSAFRKLKKKPHGFFTEGVIEQFNLLIRDIADHINSRKKEIFESKDIPSFIQFKKSFSEFQIINESEDQEEDITEEDPGDTNPKDSEGTNEFFSYDDFKKVIKTSKEKRKIGKINEGISENVNLILGKFQPFSNGHLKMSISAKKQNDCPSVLCITHPGVRSSRYPFSRETIEKMVNCVREEFPDLIKDYYFIEGTSMEEAISNLPDIYSPSSICVGEKNYDNVYLQRNWAKESGITDLDIKIFKTPTWNSGKEIRGLIKNDNFASFKKCVPKSIGVLYNQFSSEINSTNDI